MGKTLRGSFDDVLCRLYMALELDNASSGQFFAPYEVSRFMALLAVVDFANARERDFLNFAEPACGAGGIVIAMADSLHAVGVNYQRHLHVTCIDIDLRCVHMTYLLVSLSHIPAIVVQDNSISGGMWGHWYSPAHVLGGWSRRLAERRQANAEPAGETGKAAGEAMSPAAMLPSEAGAALREQMRLF